jgi:hypothetical protein
MKFYPTAAETFFSVAVLCFILVLMSVLDDSAHEQAQADLVKAEAIQQAKAEQDERKREFNRMAFEAQRITGFQAVMK